MRGKQIALQQKLSGEMMCRHVQSQNQSGSIPKSVRFNPKISQVQSQNQSGSIPKSVRFNPKISQVQYQNKSGPISKSVRFNHNLISKVSSQKSLVIIPNNDTSNQTSVSPLLMVNVPAEDIIKIFAEVGQNVVVLAARCVTRYACFQNQISY